MKKNKLYILISIVTLICFLGTAALCNQAGVEEDEVQAPTLKLEISDGPIFSDEDQVCYYEIEAIVTGTPEPDIEFTLDDNVSLLATEKAKVVLNDINDTYTLEVTATNTEGSTSASINLSWGCEEELADGEDIEEVEETAEDEEEISEDEEAVEEEQDNQGEVLEGDSFPPDLSIFIYEGPKYSAADDVCYYRIGSEMYGNPTPELTWSKDDSNRTLGWDKAQVNLRRGETYTLIATATSLEGTVTRELILSWGCDEEEVAENEGDGDADGDSDGDAEDSDGDAGDGEQVEPLSINIGIVEAESGRLVYYDNDAHFNKGSIDAGDDLGNHSIQGYISFDITPLSEATITEAILRMDIHSIAGDPSKFSAFFIGFIHWGEGTPGLSEFNEPISESQRKSFSSSGNGNIVYSDVKLKEGLQNAINSGWSRFQLKCYFWDNSNDKEYDAWKYRESGISLSVEYIP